MIDPETQFDALCDVTIRNRRIEAITPSNTSPQHKAGGEGGDLVVIDCEGLVIAPGFIDTHSHGQVSTSFSVLLCSQLFVIKNYETACHQACDGVTTHLELEFGAFPGEKVLVDFKMHFVCVGLC